MGNKASLMIALAYCFESFQDVARERSIGRAQRSSWVEETVLRVWGDQGSWSFLERVPERRELNSKISWRSTDDNSCVCSGGMIGTCMWRNYLRPGKESSKMIRETLACIHTGPRIVSVPSSQTRKPQDSWNSG